MTTTRQLLGHFQRIAQETRILPPCQDEKSEDRRAGIVRRLDETILAIERGEEKAVVGPVVCGTCRLEHTDADCPHLARRVPPVPKTDKRWIVKRLPELKWLAKASDALIVSSETSTGKTTCLPRALANDFELTPPGKKVIVTLPRRLAATECAEQVAKDLGERVGLRVGYSIAYGKQFGPNTAILYCTVGVVWQRLINGDLLEDASVLVLDEVHVRSIELDMVLSVFKLYITLGYELPKLVICSATLSADTFATFLNCQRPRGSFNVTVKQVFGRLFKLRERKVEGCPDETQQQGVQACFYALKRLVTGGEMPKGPHQNIIVFLPEKRGCDKLKDFLKKDECFAAFDVFALYRCCNPRDLRGSLDQLSARKCIVVATNIVETSLTVPGVVAVVNSGLHRVKHFRSGIGSLELEHTTPADNEQRAGRGGRVAESVFMEVFDPRRAQAAPNVVAMQREDIRNALLGLCQISKSGRASINPRTFEFISPPTSEMLEWSLERLENGELIDGNFQILPLGVMASKLPMDCDLAASVARSNRAGCMSLALIIASVALAKQEFKLLKPSDFPRDELEKEEQVEQIREAKRKCVGTHRLLLAAWNVFHGEGGDWAESLFNVLHPRCLERAVAIHDGLMRATSRWVKPQTELVDEEGLDAFERCLVCGFSRTLSRHTELQPPQEYTLVGTGQTVYCHQSLVQDWQGSDHFVIALGGLFCEEAQKHAARPSVKLQDVVVVPRYIVREMICDGTLPSIERNALLEANFLLCESAF